MRAILTYHSIDRSGSVISIEPAAFRRHAEWLSRSGVSVVGLRGLLDLEPGRPAVALTFDDGFANFASEAWPVLEGYGFPATLFVATGHVGTVNAWESGDGPPLLPLLDWPELGRLAEQGVMLGSHSMSHTDLRRSTDGALIDELERSADRMKAETGFEPAVFAYPYGRVDERVANATRARYSLAVTTEFRELRAGDDPLRLPRLDAWYFRETGRLEAFGTSSFRRFVTVRRQLRRARRIFFSKG